MADRRLASVASATAAVPRMGADASVFGWIVAVGLVPVLAAAARWLPEEDPLLVAVKLISATLLVAVIPGASLALAARCVTRLSLLELTGIGIAVSLGLVQLLTIVSLLVHVSALEMTFWLVAGATSLLALARWRAAAAPVLTVERGDLLIGLPLLVIVGLLYTAGSHFTTSEDSIHIAVVRRLAFVAEPALTNVYWVPETIYTYPFPGTHFLSALISRVAGVDPHFVYHKLRFFWGLGAVIFAYLAARLVFGSPSVGLASGLVAIAFVFNGTFAEVAGFSWAQLVPLSHASDVAMGTLLPALLVMTFYFIDGPSASRPRFFFFASLGLILMLTMVHIREIVQYLVYLGAFATALVVLRRDPASRNRALVLIGATLVIVVVYGLWHKYAVGHVDTLVENRKARLVATAASMSIGEYILEPFLDIYFSIFFEMFFYKWFPIIMFLSPLALFVFHRRSLALFVAASIFAYLAIVRFPFITIPYIYSTYFEILFTPVRNVVFFLHILLGATLYLVAANLVRLRRWWLGLPLAVAASALLLLVWERNQEFSAKIMSRGTEKLWRAELEVYFLALIALYLAVAGLIALRPDRAAALARQCLPAAPDRRWGVVLAIIVAPLVIWTAAPNVSPLAALTGRVGWLTGSPPLVFSTPAALMERFPCLTVSREDVAKRSLAAWAGTHGYENLNLDVPADQNRWCPPSPALMAWAHEQFTADAVFAINVFNHYSPVQFIPQQVMAWVLVDTIGFTEVFKDYFDAFHATMAKHAAQPLFNSRESLEERLEYIRAFNVTHVLVDPMYYQQMRAVLGQWPTHFVPIYDDGEWMVYEVRAGIP